MSGGNSHQRKKDKDLRALAEIGRGAAAHIEAARRMEPQIAKLNGELDIERIKASGYYQTLMKEREERRRIEARMLEIEQLNLNQQEMILELRAEVSALVDDVTDGMRELKRLQGEDKEARPLRDRLRRKTAENDVMQAKNKKLADELARSLMLLRQGANDVLAARRILESRAKPEPVADILAELQSEAAGDGHVHADGGIVTVDGKAMVFCALCKEPIRQLIPDATLEGRT